MGDEANTESDVPTRIVVGTDGSETAGRAVAKATALARVLGAELVIVSAYSRKVAGTAAVGLDLDAKWALAAGTAAEKQVTEAAEKARSQGVTSVSGRAVAGDPADVLISQVEHEGADLLVVGSKGMQSSTRFLLGSVPNKVAHHVPCDLLIVDTRD